MSKIPTKQKSHSLDKYRKLGYVHFEGFFAPSIMKAVKKNCELVLASIYSDPSNIRSRYQYNSGIIPERFDPIIDIAPVLNALAEDSKLLEVVAECIGGSPKLFKDKLILKGPGTEGYPMHQDYAWWTQFCPDPEALITVAIAIDKADTTNGALEMFAKPSEGLMATNRNLNEREKELIVGRSSPEIINMTSGDVLLLHSLAPHQSAGNFSVTSRRMLYLTYNKAAYGDLRSAYYEYYVNREREDDKNSSQKYFW
jgi:hypothetical protein